MRRSLPILLLGAAAALFSVVSVQAATSYGGKVNVVSINSVNRASGVTFANAMVNMEAASKVYNGSRAYTNTVPISKPTAGRMAKLAVKTFNGPILAITAAALAYDFLFDEDGTVTGEPRSFYVPASEATYFQQWCGQTSSYATGASGASVGQAWFNMCAQAGDTYLGVDQDWGTGGRNRYKRSNGEEYTITFTQVTQNEPLRIISDQEMSDAIEEEASDPLSIVRDLAKGAMTNPGLNPDGTPATNPLRDAWTELGSALAAQEAALSALEALADANGDGVLTQAEVDAFLEQNPDAVPAPPPQYIPPTEPAPIEFPDDYAREPTLQKVEGHLNPETVPDPPADDAYNSAWDAPFQQVEDEISNTDLPGLPDPSFNIPIPGGGACQSITMGVFGVSWTVPGPTGCALLADVKNILGWFLYVLTVIYLVGLFFRPVPGLSNG